MSIPINVRSNRSQNQNKISASATKNTPNSRVSNNAIRVGNTSGIRPQVAIVTDKKTVHFADLNTLGNNVDNILKNIKMLLKDVSNNNRPH